MPSADQVPIDNPHSTMRGGIWVVLIAGSTGSALRAVGAMDLGIADNGECAGNEQAAQIAIASFADTAEPVFTSARVLLWHDADPGREVTSRSEGSRVGNSSDHSRGQCRTDARYIV